MSGRLFVGSKPGLLTVPRVILPTHSPALGAVAEMVVAVCGWGVLPIPNQLCFCFARLLPGTAATTGTS